MRQACKSETSGAVAVHMRNGDPVSFRTAVVLCASAAVWDGPVLVDDGMWSIPSISARRSSCAEFVARNFLKRLARCDSTVLGAICSRVAIS